MKRESESVETVNIGSVYQTHVLHLCEKHVLTTSNWVSHHDVDEFLMVDAPGWSSPIPSPIPSSSETQQWTYPLHSLFEQLKQATCVPILRYPFQNYGVRTLGRDQFVTQELTVRDRIPSGYHTYGKVSLVVSLSTRNVGLTRNEGEGIDLPSCGKETKRRWMVRTT